MRGAGWQDLAGSGWLLGGLILRSILVSKSEINKGHFLFAMWRVVSLEKL